MSKRYFLAFVLLATAVTSSQASFFKPTPTVSPTPSAYLADVLLFDGTGTSLSNAQALADIVQAHGLSYRRVGSAALNSMSLSDLTHYRMFVWPGGDSIAMDSSLTSETRTRVRRSVREYGVGFSGFCAGAWIAVGPAPGTSGFGWGFSIVTGNYLKEYFPDGKDPGAAMVPVTFADGSVRNLVWWGGPYLNVIPGGVVGRYANGDPAIVETYAGKGYVTLSGPHPEAPMNWRTGASLYDTDGIDTDIAWNLIRAALNRTPLRAF